jgi:hypothetical protein
MKSDSKLPQVAVLVFVVFGFLFLAMSVPRLLPADPAVMVGASASEFGMRDIFTRIASSLFFVMVASVIAVYLGKSSPEASLEEFDPDRTLNLFEKPYDKSPILARINVVDIE